MTGPNRTPGAWLKGDDWKFGTPRERVWKQVIADPARVVTLDDDLARADVPRPPLDVDPFTVPADYGTVAPDRATRIDWGFVSALVVAGLLIATLIALWPTK